MTRVLDAVPSTTAGFLSRFRPDVEVGTAGFHLKEMSASRLIFYPYKSFTYSCPASNLYNACVPLFSSPFAASSS